MYWSLIKGIAEHILKDHGFILQCKNSIIYGLCRECREKQDRE
jgi:Fur family ferric uptake transcriptional regulator